MRLTKEAVEAIKTNKELKSKLCYELQRHSDTIVRLVNDNKDEGLLTTGKAVETITKISGLKKPLTK